MLQYTDTHRDKQILKTLIAEVSNVAFTAKLQGLQSRHGTRNAKQNVHNNLEKYLNMIAEKILTDYQLNQPQWS